MLMRMILLTKSKKPGGYCTAGIDIKNGNWIRIVGNNDKGISQVQLAYEDGRVAEELDIVGVECKQYSPNYFQPENYLMDIGSKWIYLGKATIQQVLELHCFEQRYSFFYNDKYRISDEEIKEINIPDMYSLTMINITNPVVLVDHNPNSGNQTVSLNFNYLGVNYKYYRITDLDVLEQYSKLDDGEYALRGNYIVVISLGENYYGYHYKLVAKIMPYVEEKNDEIMF